MCVWTVIICRILHELALAPPAEQDVVAKLFRDSQEEEAQQHQEARVAAAARKVTSEEKDSNEAGEPRPRPSGRSSSSRRNGAADAWIDAQLQRHLFFPQSAKYLDADTTLPDGTTLRKGDIIGFNYGQMYMDRCVVRPSLSPKG